MIALSSWIPGFRWIGDEEKTLGPDQAGNRIADGDSQF